VYVMFSNHHNRHCLWC